MTKPAIHLPKDHGLHKDPIEWWYWTAQGTTDQGRPIALMFALFKGSIFGLANLYFAHWFVTDTKKSVFKPRFNVFWKGLEDKGLKNGALDAKSGHDFRMMQYSDGNYLIKTPDFELKLKPSKPAMMVGGSGFVDLKTSTTYYYSLPRLETKGYIVQGGKKHGFQGLAWMDHQWSPVTMNTEHAWTWFSFQLSDGTDLQCFEYGRTKRTRLATVSWPDGKQSSHHEVILRHSGKLWKSKVSEAKYPLDWNISIPSAGIEIHCRPKNNEQEMIHGPFRYWEGPLTAEGTVKGTKVAGNGFLELNGIKAEQNIFRFFLNILNSKE